jgi:hypothetical protein
MKKSFLFFTIISILISCSKDENITTNNTPSPSSKSYISMKINGVEWKTDASTIAAGISDANFVATGSKTVGTKTQAISMAIEKVNTTGNNIYDKNTKGALLFIDNVNGISWGLGSGSNGNGTLKITKTKVIGSITQASATFSGSTKDGNGTTITITDGIVYNALVE